MFRQGIRVTLKRPLGRVFLRSYSTYYDLFPKTFPNGPPPKGQFMVDKGSLKREYIQLQSESHPDKAVNQDIEDDGKSSQISVAYKALLNPLHRAENILLSRGVDALAEKDSLTDEELLMDVLMARESIADAETREDLEQIRKENDSRIAESEKILDQAFQKDDLEAARAETVKLSYWQSIRHQINEKENS
ncbi:hypothetical protein TRICI_002592 [Trichomonascus ciferrii]|uniref:Co-chaperone HscB C-terminal oligomerisation domain-containing protein n=1 Tax=Trichomonascus ciferrii TaxID=44093 RepID=A0A642V6I5_9ASCO|nr:hypothetical protein TRICI_002592 [Trichomonascus ciferrii]